MGNEQGSVLDRAPLNSPCELTWGQLKTEASIAGREGHCSAVINNKIYSYGGLGETELDKYGLSVFDVEDGKWTDITAQGPGPLSNATLNVVGNKLYLFGGLNREIGWNNDLWCFDTDTQQWNKLTPDGSAPTPRDKHSCITKDQSLIVFGGFGPDPGDCEEGEEEEEGAPSAKFTWFNDVYIYDTAINRWGQPRLTAIEGPEPCAAHTATLWNDYMIVFGGKTSKCRTQHLYLLDLEKLEWSRFEDAGQRPLPCSFHCAAQYKHYMIVYGGRKGDNTHSSDIHVLDCNSGGWYSPVFASVTDSTPTPGARGQASLSVLDDGRAVVLGGSDNFNLLNQCCQKFPRELFTINCKGLKSVEVPAPAPIEEEYVPEGEQVRI